jgi:ABC-type molybdate transport system ATPase subunit
VAVSVYPWEITIDRSAEPSARSDQNSLPVEVISVTSLGQRVRLALVAAVQLLTAEVSATTAHDLELTRGSHVTARWPASATRILAR